MSKDLSISNPWGEEVRSPADTMEELARRLSQPSVPNPIAFQANTQYDTFSTSLYEGLLNSQSQSQISLEPVEVDPWTGTFADVTRRLSESNISKTTMAQNNPVADIDPFQSNIKVSQDVRNLPQDTYTDVITVHPCTVKSLFGHVDYSISSKYHQKTVTRRYSDFLWLQECLLQKYPFRTIPALPPKKAVIGSDVKFLERRTRGLARFLNIVGVHPVFRVDELVILFLTSTDTIAHLKSNLPIQEEEMAMLSISDEMMNEIPSEFGKSVDSFVTILKTQLQDICEICGVLERLVCVLSKTREEIGLLTQLLRKTTVHTNCIFENCQACKSLDGSAEVVGEGLTEMNSLTIEHSKTIEEAMIEKLKMYRDILGGYQVMLGRRSSHLTSTAIAIQTIQKRITANKNRIVEMTVRNVTQKELDRVGHLVDQVIEIK
jgi:hypothetical protein